MGRQRFSNVDILEAVRPLDELKAELRAQRAGKWPLIGRRIVGEHRQADRVRPRACEACGDDRRIEAAGHAEESALCRCPCANAMPDHPRHAIDGFILFDWIDDMVPWRPAGLLRVEVTWQANCEAGEQLANRPKSRCRRWNERAIKLPPDLFEVDVDVDAARDEKLGVRGQVRKTAPADIIAREDPGGIAQDPDAVRVDDCRDIPAPEPAEDRLSPALHHRCGLVGCQ
jgi:hypothetical protein